MALLALRLFWIVWLSSTMWIGVRSPKICKNPGKDLFNSTFLIIFASAKCVHTFTTQSEQDAPFVQIHIAAARCEPAVAIRVDGSPA